MSRNSDPFHLSMLARSVRGSVRLLGAGIRFFGIDAGPLKRKCHFQSSRWLSQEAAGRTWEDRLILQNPHNNIPKHIAALVGRDLHLIKSHPLAIIKQKIVKVCGSPTSDATRQTCWTLGHLFFNHVALLVNCFLCHFGLLYSHITHQSPARRGLIPSCTEQEQNPRCTRTSQTNLTLSHSSPIKRA
jgi:hypothetical protein